jgi:hypothetical protein
LPDPLRPENEDAFFVFGHVSNQAIFAGMNAVPIDLNYPAVKFIMDLYGIKNQRDCFERVLKLWHHVAKIDRAKRKAKQN